MDVSECGLHFERIERTMVLLNWIKYKSIWKVSGSRTREKVNNGDCQT